MAIKPPDVPGRRSRVTREGRVEGEIHSVETALSKDTMPDVFLSVCAYFRISKLQVACLIMKSCQTYADCLYK